MLNDQSLDAQNFLDKHVHARANLLISELLEKGQRDWDLTESQWYQDLFSQYEEDFPELREPFEFWIVSDFFAQKLKEEGALLTKHWGFWIWGRETTGQSILIDYIFQKIWESFKTSK